MSVKTVTLLAGATTGNGPIVSASAIYNQRGDKAAFLLRGLSGATATLYGGITAVEAEMVPVVGAVDLEDGVTFIETVPGVFFQARIAGTSAIPVHASITGGGE